MSKEQSDAIKRVRLKRYLRKLGFDKTHNQNLAALQKMVRAIHSKVRMLAVIKQHHYLRNLFAMKSMWGSGLTFAVDGTKTHTCHTVQDLIDFDACPAHLVYLDNHLPQLIGFDKRVRLAAL